MPLTKHLNVAIIDGNPALGSRVCFNKGDPPDARVSTVTPATISLFKGSNFDIFVILNNVLCHLQNALNFHLLYGALFICASKQLCCKLDWFKLILGKK